LSSARAASIAKLLVDEGIDEKRLAVVGYGEHHPIAENETPQGRAQNRRVVLMIAREKMKRPIINTQAEVKEAVDSSIGPEQAQVNPQPGLENNKVSQEVDNNLSPKEKMDRLIESNSGLGIDSVLTLDDDFPATESDVDDEEEDQKIRAVETNKGGLLFSSDPDLPRSE